LPHTSLLHHRELKEYSPKQEANDAPDD